eukprot:7426281-Lingulodinium_polyedra.AAC.1
MRGRGGMRQCREAGPLVPQRPACPSCAGQLRAGAHRCRPPGTPASAIREPAARRPHARHHVQGRLRLGRGGHTACPGWPRVLRLLPLGADLLLPPVP